MPSFLITWKPATENSGRGWPLEELLRVASNVKQHGSAVEDWRFQSHRAVSVGDRVYLLRQGRRGPAILGYGSVAGAPSKRDHWRIPVKFEALVDPRHGVLATSAELQAITPERSIWGTESSGRSLPPEVFAKLERLVVGRMPVAEDKLVGRNPPWTRDELILALELYFRVNPLHTSENHPEILALSELLNSLPIHPATPGVRSFRNPNGVYMKLCNYLRLDPSYSGKGLDAGSKLDEEVWNEFANDRVRLADVATAIRANASAIGAPAADELLDADDEANEGQVLTRAHKFRERSQRLVRSKKDAVLRRLGRLACEVCGFDFEAQYASLGRGFAECHHTVPLHALNPSVATRLSDLAILCANCHRMIHRARPWLGIDQLKKQLVGQATCTNGAR